MDGADGVSAQRFRKKPVEIEAMRFGPTAKEGHDVTSWMDRNGYVGLISNATKPDTLRYPDQLETDGSRPDKGWYIDPANGDLMIRTLEGDMRASVGDWIIRGVAGEFYPCRGDIFEQTYEAVEG